MLTNTADTSAHIDVNVGTTNTGFEIVGESGNEVIIDASDVDSRITVDGDSPMIVVGDTTTTANTVISTDYIQQGTSRLFLNGEMLRLVNTGNCSTMDSAIISMANKALEGRTVFIGDTLGMFSATAYLLVFPVNGRADIADGSTQIPFNIIFFANASFTTNDMWSVHGLVNLSSTSTVEWDN